MLLPGTSVASAADLTETTVAFHVPGREVLVGVAAFRADCEIMVSGEGLQLLANETARTTVGATPAACTMVLTLFGFDVTIPTINTTPLGRSSVYIPGLSIVTIGIVDVSIDLMTTMNSSTHVGDPTVAVVEPAELTWTAWAAQRVEVRGAGGFGSRLTSTLNTTFTYSLALGITVLVLGGAVYHTDLVDLGRYVGGPSLVTSLSVDLIPHPLALGSPRDITDSGATLNWTGSVDADVNHLELWVTDGTLNVSYRIANPHTAKMTVPLKADTSYTAWIVAVDGAGQSSSSAAITFRTASAPTPPPSVDVVSQANGVLVGTVAAIAAFLVFIAFLLGEVRGRKRP